MISYILSVIRFGIILNNVSQPNKLNLKRKTVFVALLVIIVSSVSSLPSLAFADNAHHSKAARDGTGIGEGSIHDKNHKHVKVSHNNVKSNPVPTFCNCVIFRLDDVQDYWISDIQQTVMDQFIQKNQSLSAGPILDYIGDDGDLLIKINEGTSKGLFELFVHGWDHVDYTQMDMANQTSSLQMANDKMTNFFGTTSTIFVPPYDVYNTDTLSAMKQTGFKIISPAEWAGNYPSFIADGKSNIADNYGIYHLPESVGFVEFSNNTSTRVSNAQILGVIDSKIATQGYAVVTLHAQDFRQKVNGVPIDMLNQTEVQDLDSLIDSVISKNYHIRTFNQVVSFKPAPVQYIPVKTGGNQVQDHDVKSLDGINLKKVISEKLEHKEQPDKSKKDVKQGKR
jgi:peptidoglycan/xylan/chitin deacetylase (PgdA/CDA1 family)